MGGEQRERQIERETTRYIQREREREKGRSFNQDKRGGHTKIL